MINPDLIKRLASATEGSRAFDYEIHEAIGWQDNDECGWSRGVERTGPDWPLYTSSLDAALTLLIGEARPQIAMQEHGLWRVHIGYGGGKGVPGPFNAKAPTAALALCIAALCAHDAATGALRMR